MRKQLALTVWLLAQLPATGVLAQDDMYRPLSRGQDMQMPSSYVAPSESWIDRAFRDVGEPYSRLYAGGGFGMTLAGDNVEEGPAAHVFAELLLMRYLSLRGTLALSTGDSQEEVDGLARGTMAMSSVEGSLLLRRRVGQVTPYLGGGIGYYYPDYDIDTDWATIPEETIGEFVFPEWRLRQGVDSDVGYHVLGGLLLHLGRPGLQLYLEAKHVFLEPEAWVTLTIGDEMLPEGRREIDLDTTTISFGARASF